ncbi:MAG: hypothetical protein WCA15_20670 [Candidatus Acidiferrales bacterium]
MDDIKAVVNNYGVVFYVNFATDRDALADLLGELGGVRSLTTPDRAQLDYGNGLTKDSARRILKRRGVPFSET